MNEFIINYDKSITVGLIMIVFAIIIFGAYRIAKVGVRNAKIATLEEAEYKDKYKKISKIINKNKVCTQNYNWIERLFDNLRKCKYKNPEMTEVLYDKFREKYQDIAKKRVNEND